MHRWLLALGSALGVLAGFAAFSQPASDPSSFTEAMRLAAWFAFPAILLLIGGLVLRTYRRQ